MSAKALAATVAVVTTMVVLIVGLGGGSDDPQNAAGPDELAISETSLTEGAPVDSGTTTTTIAPPATTTTVTPPTSTTAPPATTVPPSTTTTTTTTTPTTTTATPAAAPSSDYTPIPKAGGGPNAVAPGGALTKHLAADIAAAFGFTTAEVETAIAGVLLPAEASGNPEGWLAPGTYPDEAAGAGEVVQAMVDRRVEQLEARQVPRDQWYRVLTAASVIEKETYNQNEKPRVARVLANRLAGGGKLQMDSIILYPVPEDRIFTTSAERASNQPYNSYRHNGLPPTPISAPDEASLDAFLAPPPGDWWFYVTIDLHSGETRFAVTFAEHEENVELLRAWQRDNPTP